MADNQDKYSPSEAQGTRPSAQASTQPAVKTDQPEDQPSAMEKRDEIIARYEEKRRFYRFGEVEGKTLSFIEVHIAGDQHAIDVRFKDNTALHLVIERGFSVYTEFADWESGESHSIKRWPFIRSLGSSGPRT